MNSNETNLQRTKRIRSDRETNFMTRPSDRVINLYVETKLSSNSYDISFHSFGKEASSLLFHFLHFHQRSITDTSHLCWPGSARLLNFWGHPGNKQNQLYL